MPNAIPSFDVGGKTYRTYFGLAAACQVEAATGGAPFLDTIQTMASGKVSMTTLAKLFHAGLAKHHPGVDEAQAIELMEELGFDRLGDVLLAAVEASPVFQGAAADKKKASGR